MIDDMERFLCCAARLEADAATAYEVLSARMLESNNLQVADLFARFGGFSRMHLAEIRARMRAELGTEPEWKDITQSWPDGYSPENPLAQLDSSAITPRRAIEMALETERKACDFYSAVAGQTRAAQVQEAAQEFAEEEAEHVEHLEKWLHNLDAPVS